MIPLVREYPVKAPDFLWAGWPMYTTVPKGLPNCWQERKGERSERLVNATAAKIHKKGFWAYERCNHSPDSIKNHGFANRVRISCILGANQAHQCCGCCRDSNWNNLRKRKNVRQVYGSLLSLPDLNVS